MDNNTTPNLPENNPQPAPLTPNEPVVTNTTPFTAASTPAEAMSATVPAPNVVAAEFQTQPVSSPQVSPSATGNSQPIVGLSASQMGLNGPSKKPSVNIKKLILSVVGGLVVISAILAILIATNVIAFSKFKTLDYTNSKGTKYQLTFYSKHTATKLKTGNTQLVSKVSEEGKFPITLSISTADSNGSYDKYKNCGSFTKAFEVENNNLNQNIAVCDVLANTQAKAGVYIAVFSASNQSHVLTISQDLSGLDTSSAQAAKDSLQKFGLGPYESDIKTIIASIKVE